MIKFKSKKVSRLRRIRKIREEIKKVNKIRLVIHKTSRHTYAQVISSESNAVLVCASTLEKKINKKLSYTGNKKAACLIGEKIAIRLLRKGIKKVSFDRSGYKYHGRIKSLADSARKKGLLF